MQDKKYVQGQSTYDNLEKIPRLITKHSSSVPLPPGYHTDLPDLDPVNARIYADFHNQVGKVLQSYGLFAIEKVVMIAYLIHGIDASEETILKATSIQRVSLLQAQNNLVCVGWLDEKFYTEEGKL